MSDAGRGGKDKDIKATPTRFVMLSSKLVPGGRLFFFLSFVLF